MISKIGLYRIYEWYPKLFQKASSVNLSFFPSRWKVAQSRLNFSSLSGKFLKSLTLLLILISK